jgi:hypothetical protein
MNHRPAALLKVLLLAACLSTATGCPDSISPLGGNSKREPAAEPATSPNRPLARESASSNPHAAAPASVQGSTSPLSAPSNTPPAAEPNLPLGGIARAPKLPPGFVADVKATGSAAGLEAIRTGVLIRRAERQEGRFACVVIALEDRVPPNKDDRIRAYKALFDDTRNKWLALGFRVEKEEVPDADSIDTDGRIRARMTFLKDDQRLVVEQWISFPDGGLHVGVVADHDDDLELLTQWADSIRPN